MAPPGLQPPAGVPSHGSALHGTGSCHPCAWFWKSGGCLWYENCWHCHSCDIGEIKRRRKRRVAIIT